MISIGYLALALVLAAASPMLGRTVDYLHIEANEGDSSGGHAAIRFEDRVYHFQHDGGLVRVRRDSWKRFEHRYRTLKNRGISLNRIETSEETYEILSGTFRRRYLVQERELKLLDELRREVNLLEAMAAGRDGLDHPGVLVRGAGFFEGTAHTGDSVDSRALTKIRRHIGARHGKGFLAARRNEIARHLAELRPTTPELPSPDPTSYPAIGELFAERDGELRAATAAIEVLLSPHRLNPNRLVEAAGSRRLRPGEPAKLRTIADSLADSLSRLPNSRRPDWGYPFLLGLARLVAIERSLEGGRLILLDAIPDDAERLPLVPRRRQALPDLLIEAESDRTRATRRALSGDTFREASWTDMETAVSRVAELRRAQAGASELRVRPGALLPRGDGMVELRSTSPIEPEHLSRSLRLARERERSYAAALRERYGYHLLLRNCVSEIFRTIHTALSESGSNSEQLRETSRQRLGGYVAPTSGFNFIPFVSAFRVRNRYAVASRLDLPSFRHYQLEKMYARELPLRVALRESNVWTSTLYTPNDDDGFFVFFTDRTVLLRPLLGTANLVASTARAGIGLALAPVDGAQGLRSGLSGALFSLPELLFVNLRKGSNEYVKPEMRPPGTP